MTRDGSAEPGFTAHIRLVAGAAMNNAGLAAHRFGISLPYLLLPSALSRELDSPGRGRRELSCLDNGGEFRNRAFTGELARLGVRHRRIHAGRPQTNGHVEALQRTILDECWRPAFARYLHVRFTGLRQELERYLEFFNFDRVHHGRLTQGTIPADVVYGARKMEAR